MVSSTFQFPPLDDSLLFTELVNYHMIRNPTFPLFVYTNENAQDTLTEISFLEFGQAAHRIAHALRPSRRGRDGEVIMIIAHTDTILYQALLVGLSIAGWVPFPVSPRNSATAVVHMMKKSDCTHIVTLDCIHKAFIDDIRRENEEAHLTIHEVPSLQYAFPHLGREVVTEEFVPYPPPLERPDLDSPAIYLHSSGSTGFPKPIPHSYRIQAQWLAQPWNCVYRDLCSPRRVGSMALPPFHIFGIVAQLYVPIACVVSSVVYPPRTAGKDPGMQPVIPTSDNIIDCVKKTECNILFTVPSFLEQMAKSPEAVEILKKLDYVRFGGGPLPAQVGDALWDGGVKLSNAFGATEMGVPVAVGGMQDLSGGEWAWMRFADDLKIRWAPQGDDTYELQILSTDDRRMAIENLPDIRGYATSDLFVKHPTKDLWRSVGRVDDVITLASGEKTVPGPMESIIGSSPLVQGVVMFGRERTQVGVLIEPRSGCTVNVQDEYALAEFRNQIWPVIEEANKQAPAFSRIFKEMILLTSGDKAMARTPKGTPQRKATLKAYETEINSLYDAVILSMNGIAEPAEWTGAVVQEWLVERACSINSGNQVDPYRDLFAQGFDSLSATFLRNSILGALRESSDPTIKRAAIRVPPNVVFENPTIQLLSSRITAIVDDDSGRRITDSTEQHKKTIDAMIEKYSIGLEGPVDGMLPNSPPPIEPAVVLITGTTGGLGSFMLSELLKKSAVQRIFALNRPSATKTIEQRQKAAFRDRGLVVDLLDSDKLVYIEADTSLEKCGLSLGQHEEIRSSVTTIIHNAWRLDFNLSIASFEENVCASRNLVDLGLDSHHKEHLRFLFTSSIGSAQGWSNSNGPFPEQVQLDPSVAIGTGYGESKYVAERVIVKSGLHATSLRIGQIVGGSNGCWATTDWFPILIKSSVTLGVLPEAAGVVSWLREQDVSSAILETAFAREAPLPALNISNPRHVPWAEIIAFVRRSIVQRKGLPDDALPIVPFGEWFRLLENRAANASQDDMQTVPAIKLLEFFRSLAREDEVIRRSSVGVTEAGGIANLSTAEAQRTSPAMKNMQAVGATEADAWVTYWMSRGAL